MRKQRAYILIGLPGAGKSTWSQSQIDKGVNPNGCVIVSRDAIRNMLNGSYKYVESQQKLITQIAADAAKSILDRGQDLIVDQANMSKAVRKEVTDFIVREIRDRDEVELFFIQFLEDDVKTLVDRRMAGDDRGEDRAYHCKVILDMKKKFEEVGSEEDWDYRLKINGEGQAIDKTKRCEAFLQGKPAKIEREELWDLSATFAKFILPRLKAFREQVPACPGGIGYENDGTRTYSVRRGPDPKHQLDYEKWNGIVDRMILGFELELTMHDWDCDSNSKEFKTNWAKIEEGLHLFAKYYNGLWW